MERPVALIGIGLMGSALAERLLAAGFTVRGHDTDPDRLAAFASSGGPPCIWAKDAAAGCAAVITCLLTGTIVRQAVLGTEGAAEGMAAGSVLIDTTTCAPRESVALAADLRARGIAMLDAPLSGSSAQARRGEAVALVGGDAAVLERCRPILDAVARKVFHLGPNGAGSTAKLMTNLVLGLNRLALAEGLSLGAKAGLEPRTLLEVLREGAAYSRCMDAKGERMIEGRFDPEARLAQHYKDVGLILALAEELQVRVPVSKLHRELLEEGLRMGLGDLDNSAIIRVLER